MIEANGKLYSLSVKFVSTAQKRDITLEEVELAMQEPDEQSESLHDPQNRILYEKLIDDRWITVVVDEAL